MKRSRYGTATTGEESVIDPHADISHEEWGKGDCNLRLGDGWSFDPDKVQADGLMGMCFKEVCRPNPGISGGENCIDVYEGEDIPLAYQDQDEDIEHEVDAALFITCTTNSECDRKTLEVFEETGYKHYELLHLLSCVDGFCEKPGKESKTDKKIKNKVREEVKKNSSSSSSKKKSPSKPSTPIIQQAQEWMPEDWLKVIGAAALGIGAIVWIAKR